MTSSFVHRDCRRDAAAGKGLCCWSSWEATQLPRHKQPSAAAGSCSAHSCSSTQLLQGTRPLGSPAPTADSALQSDITLQGWSSPSSASRGLQWLLCYSLSHSCAICTKVWIPATEQSASSSLGGPGWWLPLVRAFSIFCRTIFVTKHSLFILIPCYSGFYIYWNFRYLLALQTAVIRKE